MRKSVGSVGSFELRSTSHFLYDDVLGLCHTPTSPSLLVHISKKYYDCPALILRNDDPVGLRDPNLFERFNVL